ncbi:hypothetical protein [Variovorax sp. YR752]|uniref:hypothetical protein n=1 Tax=Variovorax sp. YR752 TaxID=1884383 RepID=UPI003137D1EA
MRPLSRRACAMLLVLALAGCSRNQPSAPAIAPAPPVAHAAESLDDELVLILPDLMDMLVDPAAGVLFAAADPPARTDLEPRSAEAWQAVVDAASQLAQTSGMLADPVLSRGRADWLQWAEAMRDGAAAGAAAARRHDPRSLYAAGQRVKASCQGCHARYATQIAEPLALRLTR